MRISWWVHLIKVLSAIDLGLKLKSSSFPDFAYASSFEAFAQMMKRRNTEIDSETKQTLSEIKINPQLLSQYTTAIAYKQ